MELFNFRDVWQPILSILTNGSFMLNVQQSPNNPNLTHMIINFRSACRAARAMIPAPTHLEPNQLFIEGAKNGNIDLCNLAEKYGNKDYGIALRNAVIRGYNDIVDMILDKLDEKNIEIDELGIIPLDKATEHHHVDICEKLLEIVDTRNTNINYLMSYGAAKGGHADIIEWIKQEYELDYTGLLLGAISGNHAKICDMALESGQFDINNVTDLISCSKNIEKYARLRDCMKRHGQINAGFYQYFMQAIAIQRHEDIAKTLYKWSVEDKCQINHQLLLQELIEIFIDDVDANCALYHADEHMCNVMHKFSKLDNYRIDYDDLISSLGWKAKYAINIIKRWAKDAEYEITAEFDNSDEEDFDDDYDEFGDRNIREIYYNIRTWDDLLNANVDYLRGIVSETYHYGTPFHDTHAELSKLEHNLIHLHEEHKIFIYNALDLKNRERCGKLEFICLPEQGHKLIPKLLGMEEIYISARRLTKTNGVVFYKNIPKDIIASRVSKNFYSDTGEDGRSMAEIEAGGYPNIQSLLRKCYHVFITFREFPKSADEPEIMTILLDALQELDNQERII